MGFGAMKGCMARTSRGRCRTAVIESKTGVIVAEKPC